VTEKPEAQELQKPRSLWKRVALLVAGWGFVVLGLLGLFLPILQGLLFLAIGLYLLSLEVGWVRRLLHRLRARYPRFGRALDDAHDRLVRVARRIRGTT